VSDGNQVIFAAPPAYIKKEYIHAYSTISNLDGYYDNNSLTPLAFGWINEGMIRLHEPVPINHRIIVRRETFADEPLVDFQDAAILTETDLDLAELQALHVAQEARDQGWANLGDILEYFKALHGLVKNIQVENALLKERFEVFKADTLSFLEAIENLQEKAQAALDEAKASQQAAWNSSKAAELSEYWARLWASQSPGVEVLNGLFSARHYADRAQAEGGNVAEHVASEDPHPQYIQEGQFGDGFLEEDDIGDVQLRAEEPMNNIGKWLYKDAWGNIALF
jgi:hypothetical protein